MKTSRCGTVAVCLTMLAACGSTTHPHEAEINAALRQLQVELEAQTRKLRAGEAFAVYAAPPKGVSGPESKAALRKDRAIQRISAALSNRSFSGEVAAPSDRTARAGWGR